MQLDRFTEKAQEAIVAAQQLAERLQSPLLDAEHILSALNDGSFYASTGVELSEIPQDFREGVDGFCSKPFKVPELVSTIRALATR